MKKDFFQFLVAIFLFLLPWQTIWITHEQFLNRSKWQYGTLGFYATEILLWMCIGLFIVWYWRKKNQIQKVKIFSWSRDRLFLFSVLLFSLFSFASILWSSNRQIALQHSLHIIEGLLLFFVVYLGPINRESVTKWFLLGATLQSILGIYQFLTQSTFAFKWLGLVAHPVVEAGTSVIVSDGVGRVMRAYGAFTHPNVFGGYLVVSIICTSFLILKEQKKQFLYKLFQVACLTLQLLALFFTFSRSAWIATLLFFIGVFIFCIKNKLKETCKIILLSFFLCVPFFVHYFPLVQTRVVHQSSHEIQSTEERVTGYKDALQIWKTSPFFGVGSGNFTVALYKINPIHPGYTYQPVHNVPLLFLSEFGIAGIVLLFGVIVTFYRVAVQVSSPKYQILFLTGIFFVLSLFDHYFYSSYLGLLLGAVYFAFIFRFSLNKE